MTVGAPDADIAEYTGWEASHVAVEGNLCASFSLAVLDHQAMTEIEEEAVEIVSDITTAETDAE